MRNKVLSLFKSKKNDLNMSYYTSATTAIYLFDFLDKLRLNKFPKNWFNLLNNDLNDLIKKIDKEENIFERSLLNFNYKDWTQNDENSIEKKTGEVYFNLWKNFESKEYFEQTAKYLNERFKKNEIKIKHFNNILDDGCGGGRYSIALKSLGIANVTGLDISENSISYAKKSAQIVNSKVDFIQGSVLDLPMKNETFDFVFSNGVLHHTVNPQKGLDEIHRVLQKDGQCWLYLYGGKNTLFWDIVDFCRELLSTVPQNYVQSLMKCLGYPPGRIFHRNDFFYVPIHQRYYISEIEEMISKSGFSGYRKLNRGIGYDWDEIIFENPNIDSYIYGEGEMRYLLKK